MQYIPTTPFVVEIGVFVGAVEIVGDELLASIMKTLELSARRAL